MRFGPALDALRSGARIARSNDEGVWLVLVGGSTITVTEGRPLGDAAPELVGQQLQYRPHIDTVTIHGAVAPWAPAHADLLADDWLVV